MFSILLLLLLPWCLLFHLAATVNAQTSNNNLPATRYYLSTLVMVDSTAWPGQSMAAQQAMVMTVMHGARDIMLTMGESTKQFISLQVSQVIILTPENDPISSTSSTGLSPNDVLSALNNYRLQLMQSGALQPHAVVLFFSTRVTAPWGIIRSACNTQISAAITPVIVNDVQETSRLATKALARTVGVEDLLVFVPNTVLDMNAVVACAQVDTVMPDVKPALPPRWSWCSDMWFAIFLNGWPFGCDMTNSGGVPCIMDRVYNRPEGDYPRCMDNPDPHPVSLFPMCGDGIVDPGEACDCGPTPQLCSNTCTCDAKTCTIVNNCGTSPSSSSVIPTGKPSNIPTVHPTPSKHHHSSPQPTSQSPTSHPSIAPYRSPTKKHKSSKTGNPTSLPVVSSRPSTTTTTTFNPTHHPIRRPSHSPSTSMPTSMPTTNPTSAPTNSPTISCPTVLATSACFGYQRGRPQCTKPRQGTKCRWCPGICTPYALQCDVDAALVSRCAEAWAALGHS